MQTWYEKVRAGILVMCAAGLALSGCAPAATPVLPHVSATPTNIGDIPNLRAENGHILTPTIEPTYGGTTAASTPSPATATETVSVTDTEPVTVLEPIYAQMTKGGCCVQPFFSADDSRVLYIDKPSPSAVTGLWSVPISQPLTAPELFSKRLGPFNAAMTYNVFLQSGRTVVERARDGQQWVIDDGGRRVVFSPDDTQLAWTVAEDSGNFDVRRGDIYIAGIDGSNPHKVATLYGGGIQAWLSDATHMLVSGKANRTDVTSTLSILNLADGSLRRLLDVERTRGFTLAPGGRYVAYAISQARDAAQDGMFVLDLTTARTQRAGFFGAYHWCSPTRLYYVPIKLSAPSNELWRYDVTTGQSTQIIETGADSPFKIGNGDWDVSNDGHRILYFSGRDHNIWLVTLPDAC